MPPKALSTDDDLKLLYLLHKQTPKSSTPKAQTMAAAMSLNPSAYSWRYRALMKRLDEQFGDLVDGNGNDDAAAAAPAGAGGKRKRPAGKGKDQADGTATTAATTKEEEEDDKDEVAAATTNKKAKVKADTANEVFKVVKVKQEPGVEKEEAGKVEAEAEGEGEGEAEVKE